jgi:hypothetical protein
MGSLLRSGGKSPTCARFILIAGAVGRTGTVVGIWPVSRGRTADETLALIEASRRGTRKEHLPSPETACQIDAIRQTQRRRA